MSKEQILERYLNTVFFGNNAYGIAGRRRDLLRQDGAGTHVHRVGVPGRPRSFAVGVRSDQRARTQPGPLAPGGRPARATRGRSRPDEALALADFVLPSRVKTLPDRAFERTYFTEALRDYLLNRSDVLGDTYQERYNQLFRGGLRIHTTLDANLQSLAEQARNVLPETPQGFDAVDRVARLDDRALSGRWSAGADSSPPSARSTWRCAPRQTGSSIKLFILAAAVQAGAQAERPPRRHQAVRAAEPGQRGRAVRDHRRSERRCRHARSRTPRSRSTARSPGSRRSSGSTGWSTRPTGWRARRTSTGISPSPTGCRSSRSPASPRAPTRCRRSTWPPVCRRSPTKACTTTRTTSSSSTMRRASACTPTSTPARRCSTAMLRSRPWRS